MWKETDTARGFCKMLTKALLYTDVMKQSLSVLNVEKQLGNVFRVKGSPLDINRMLQ